MLAVLLRWTWETKSSQFCLWLEVWRCQWIISRNIVKQEFAWTSLPPICISKCFDKWKRGKLFVMLFLVMLNIYGNVACICFLLQYEQLPKQYWNVRTRCACVRLKLHKRILLRYRTKNLHLYVKITKLFSVFRLKFVMNEICTFIWGSSILGILCYFPL